MNNNFKPKVFKPEHTIEIEGLDNLKNRMYKPWSSNQQYVSERLNIKLPQEDFVMYLYDINRKESIKLTLIPDSVSESYAARVIKESGIYGRLKPINIYTGGDAKTLSMSFELHEDLDNKHGSLYELLKRIKNLSKPVYNNILIKEPLVYLQLGSQFAGEGHVNTDYVLSLPFRNGRYIKATVNLSFTYHETFPETVIELEDEGERITATGLGIDLEDAYQRYITDLYKQGGHRSTNLEDFKSIHSISDFIDLVEGTDYQLIQMFSNEKLLGGLLNTAQEFQVGRRINVDLTDAINKGQYLDIEKSQAELTVDTFTAVVFNFYVDLSYIINSGLVELQSMVETLTQFKVKVNKFFSEFRERFIASKIASNASKDNDPVLVRDWLTIPRDWVTGAENPGGLEPEVYLTVAHGNSIMNQCLDLIGLANKQITLYNSLRGPGN